ncbi:unnamed protein product [Effrenium voratum]|uniref:Dipeptidase n=1 Tax=Effrenium voratum TaxID=2562239 RepID=A0AA36NCB2_9DINO|nr:unnamed protein product [Effrenium voratum]
MKEASCGLAFLVRIQGPNRAERRIFAMPAMKSLLTATLLAVGEACSIVAVGKDASATGYPIVSHSDDSGPSTTDVRLVRVPRRKWPKGSKRKLYEWHIPYPRMAAEDLAPEYAPTKGQEVFPAIGELDQVEETWGYWDTEYGMQNEWGLSIGESTGTGMTVGWATTKPWGHCRVGIEDLTKLAMERCKTARCAVQLMGDIAVQEGFFSADSGSPDAPAYGGSSEALVVVDAEPGDMWVFNVLTGKHNASAIWAAQRLPSDHVAAVGNSFTIRSLDLNDPENNLFSPGVTSLAEEMGWWQPSEAKFPGDFDFFGAYGYEPNKDNTPPGQLDSTRNLLSYYSGRRMWRIFSLLSPEEGAKLDPNLGNLPKTKNPYPASVRAPKHSVTRAMVMNALRDHYEGTAYDLTKGMAAGPHGSPNRGPVHAPNLKGQWERAISMFRTAYSYVLEPRPGRRSLTWFGYDAAHGTVWLPFYGASPLSAPATHTGHSLNMSTFNMDAGWWAFNLINQYSDLNFKSINGEVKRKAIEIDKEALAAIEEWEEHVKDLPEEEALQKLAQKSNDFANQKVKEWWGFAWQLIAKYGRLVITYNAPWLSS